MTIKYGSIMNQAQQAARFVDDRKDAGMPVGSKAQVAAAKRLTETNPMLRGLRGPLELQLLALKLPVNRHERRMERARLSKEIVAARADDTKTAEITKGIVEDLTDRYDALQLRPRMVRKDDSLAIEADPAAVQAFVDSNPTMTAHEAAEGICGMHGYRTGPGVALRRVTRALKSSRRMPTHIQAKARVLSAIAQAAGMIATRDAAAAKG